MAGVADPPGLLTRIRSYISWSQPAVPCGVPFVGQGRVDGLERILIVYRLTCTVRTSCPLVSVRNRGFPLMSFATNPPHLLSRKGRHIPWSQSAVFRRMPFFRKLGVNGLQTRIIGNPFPTAVRATAAVVPMSDICHPLMAFATGPPNVFAGAWGHILWG